MSRWVLIALALGSSAANGKPTKTFAEKVAASKRSLLEAADKAFVETWAEWEPKVARFGLTATAARAATQWTVMGYSLGICEPQATASALADWYSEFDTLEFGYGEYAALWRVKVHQMGAKSLTEGRRGTELNELTSQEKAQLCRVELEAVRQLLAEQ